jgi:hypothetical protein
MMNLSWLVGVRVCSLRRSSQSLDTVCASWRACSRREWCNAGVWQMTCSQCYGVQGV